MKPVFNIALKTIGLNVLSCLLLLADVTVLALIVISVIIQLIAAIAMLFSKEYRTIAQGMLIGIGVFGLVGFSACSVILFNSKI